MWVEPEEKAKLYSLCRCCEAPAGFGGTGRTRGLSGCLRGAALSQRRVPPKPKEPQTGGCNVAGKNRHGRYDIVVFAWTRGVRGFGRALHYPLPAHQLCLGFSNGPRRNIASIAMAGNTQSQIFGCNLLTIIFEPYNC